MKDRWVFYTVALLLFAFMLLKPNHVLAHCDSMDGPVIKDAKLALETHDVTPVLKWVKKEQEEGIRKEFAKTVGEKWVSPVAYEQAERAFLEELVRVHREGEGVPYTGIKPAGQVSVAATTADAALEQGLSEALVVLINRAAAQGIQDKFVNVLQKKKNADISVEAGREFVEAYTDLLHYVEKLHGDAIESDKAEGQDHD